MHDNEGVLPGGEADDPGELKVLFEGPKLVIILN